MAYDIVQTQEGNLRMATAGGEDGVTLWDSSDAGQTWQRQDDFRRNTAAGITFQ